ncbi:hypothetical protein M8C21_032577 [Ambrosia artemisiifolia]|uniref:Uncharacterized protein n=1 Tax=Ambrosia artemisiifolia TaxID=4212 RepID=A0AAD5DES0_AMBAR|nr:hypothetical protein M8C21_032577 [Ambrosia artemisiifolia]
MDSLHLRSLRSSLAQIWIGVESICAFKIPFSNLLLVIKSKNTVNRTLPKAQVQQLNNNVLVLLSFVKQTLCLAANQQPFGCPWLQHTLILFLIIIDICAKMCLRFKGEQS